MNEPKQSPYDEIASMYHMLWADWYLPAALPALEKLFFSRTPAGSHVLDLCCGSGHVTKELITRGYRVTGVDNSAELVGLAKKELPGVDFLVQDARELHLENRYDAVLSTFDSLNHIPDLDGLRHVFGAVGHVLKPGGLFVFDMNLEEAYSADLREWAVNVRDGSVGLVRGEFDAISKRARTELISFVRVGDDNLWTQRRSVVEQQCYPEAEILLALASAGFKSVEAVPSREAGITSELGFGRIFFVARTDDHE
jgi:SAM-dependent methyltransferase